MYRLKVLFIEMKENAKIPSRLFALPPKFHVPITLASHPPYTAFTKICTLVVEGHNGSQTYQKQSEATRAQRPEATSSTVPHP